MIFGWQMIFRLADDFPAGRRADVIPPDALLLIVICIAPYLRDVCFRAPDGLLMEITTDVPGFALEEAA